MKSLFGDRELTRKEVLELAEQEVLDKVSDMQAVVELKNSEWASIFDRLRNRLGGKQLETR